MPSLGAACAPPAASSSKRAAAIADTLPIGRVLVACSAAKKRQRRFVRAPGAGDEDAAVRGETKLRPAPIGGDAPCSFDDRDDRAKIVGLRLASRTRSTKPAAS